MKHATILIALACALGACSNENASNDTHAASRTPTSNPTPSAPNAADPMTDPDVARTPVPPPTPTLPPPAPVDPNDIDTRATDPVGTDATVTSTQKDQDAGMSDTLTPPGVPTPPQGQTPPQGATSADAGATVGSGAAAKPGPKEGTPAAKAALGSMDTEFISKATLLGLFEVESSELAVTQSTTPFVREFAQMMVMDHGDANSELAQLARGKGAVVPTELDQEYQSRLSTLRDQRGVDFDRQYRDMQVTAHKDAIALFDRAAANCEDAELKAWAEKVLPTLRDHQKKLNEMPPTQGG